MNVSKWSICALGLILGIWAARALAEPIPLKYFARLPEFDEVSLSPDGRYLAMIRPVDGTRSLFALDRQANDSLRGLLGGDKKGRFQMTWCKWGNATRLVCGYQAMMREMGAIFPITRMVAVNVDGTEQKVLIQNGKAGASQFQDSVIDWTPDESQSVLVEADDDENGFPSVFELNIYTGSMGTRVRERQPIRTFVADGRGNVRLGFGTDGTERSYFARLADETSWTQLAKFKAFSGDSHMTPLAITPERNKVYASGSYDGRDALWEMDLTDRDNPTLIFSHPQVDVDGPMLTQEGRMLGIYYETDRPFAFYTDDLSRAVIDGVKQALPVGNFNRIVDRSHDERLFVVKSSSDVDSGSYFLFDRKDGRLLRLGSEYPELLERQSELGRMQSIHYPASDGTEIPGYLTVPPGKRAERLPLIVMPHGGPVARDTWSFDWLVQFLVSRGYAVLQMNFRGSSGYGDDWFWAAHQDWGGLTYSDITDGARWAIKEGIADPKRMCIVGWSFGGYAALLGAVRNGDIYRCAASIAGVSDLIELEHDERYFIGGRIAREQIGKDRDKLKEDSPARHVASVTIPVLMIHGDMDYQVRVDHSRDMAKALKRAKKSYKFVEIEEADHQMSRESDRLTLLTELENFLKAHIGKDID